MVFSGQTSLLDISGIVAFGAGILSFFSPCVLPLVPSYLIFISGITFDNYIESGAGKYRKIVFIHSLAFIFGFSFIFVALGFSSSLLGSFLSRFQDYIIRVGGIFLIIMGLYYLNIIRIPFLDQHKVIHIKEKPVGLFGSFIVGITFSLGWTPCVGPVLSSILIVATASENIIDGAYLLSLYSLGMAVPFLFSSIIFDRLLNIMRRFSYVMRYSQRILGALLTIIGFLLASSLFTRISFYLGQILSVWEP